MIFNHVHLLKLSFQQTGGLISQDLLTQAIT